MSVWIYLWVFYSIPLISISVFVPIEGCFYYRSTLWELEWQHLQQSVYHSGVFWVILCCLFGFFFLMYSYMKTKNCSFKFCKESRWMSSFFSTTYEKGLAFTNVFLLAPWSRIWWLQLKRVFFFCVLYAIPFISVTVLVTFCLRYYDSVVYFEIRCCYTLSIPHVVQNPFGYSGSFVCSCISKWSYRADLIIILCWTPS